MKKGMLTLVSDYKQYELPYKLGSVVFVGDVRHVVTGVEILHNVGAFVRYKVTLKNRDDTNISNIEPVISDE